MTISHGKEAVLWRANQQQNIPMTRRRKDLTSSNPPIIRHWPTTEKGHQTNGERKERLEHSEKYTEKTRWRKECSGLRKPAESPRSNQGSI